MLGYEFINKHHGEKVQLTGGKSVEIFSVGSYEQFIKRQLLSQCCQNEEIAHG